MGDFPRVQSVVVPILRGDPRLAGVTITTWVPDVDFREFPMINVRRIGGIRNPNAPTIHNLPVIEMTAYSTEGLIECEELYETALEVLYDAVKNGTQTPAGYLQSIYETMGATQFSSLFQDSWRIQGLIRLGVRKPRSTT
ncbi:tail terminator [Mycobacterium phage Mulciber]|uniref:tail terminator n=1 Tax=Mycobacterium phage Mulciber TaxID=1805459 RepID=UPI00078D25A7|nr:tail terminator [Mycobacterium phage Mulciber]AQT28222.1 tail terminator [Mycobacterium phage Jabith]ASR86659.1 tail terminator [Mycobacterium phage Et2Brutus]QBI97858.1 tail terminator [Mycobacterium phage Orange]QBI98490.1 tail terminator [Mycobacterium phage Bud]QPX61947.1 tail terminator [Mycobacterium phage Flaverint]